MNRVFLAIDSAGGTTYDVGGSVRDELVAEFTGRAVENKDRDFCVTGLALDALTDILSRFGKVDLVGASFGVIKFTYQGETYDFALPRREQSTGEHHRDFDVQADPDIPIEDDLGRRDFTLNAMAREVLTRKLVDPFNGRSAIRTRTISMVNPQAFQDDPLRMWRAVQFAARFGFRLDHGTMAAMKEQAHLSETVSPERIAMELGKMFDKADCPSVGLNIARKAGLLDYALPELARLYGLRQPEQYHMYEAFRHTMEVVDFLAFAPRPIRVALRFAALLHDLGKFDTYQEKEDGTPTFHGHENVSADHARAIIDRLRLTCCGYKFDVDHVVRLVKYHQFNVKDTTGARSLRKWISKVGADLPAPARNRLVMDLMRLRVADRYGHGHFEDLSQWVGLAKKIRGIISRKAPLSRGDLSVNGRDLMAAGVPGGKHLKDILQTMVDAVLDDPDLNKDKKALLTVGLDKARDLGVLK